MVASAGLRMVSYVLPCGSITTARHGQVLGASGRSVHEVDLPWFVDDRSFGHGHACSP